MTARLNVIESKRFKQFCLLGLIVVIELIGIALAFSQAGLATNVVGLLLLVLSPFIQIPANLWVRPWKGSRLIQITSLLQLPTGIYAIYTSITFIVPRITDFLR